MTERNPTLAQIVRRHFHGNPVTGRDLNEMFAHFARNMGQNLMATGQFDTIHRGRQDLDDRAIYLNQIFFIPCHTELLCFCFCVKSCY
jgi:hypothetical protein